MEFVEDQKDGYKKFYQEYLSCLGSMRKDVDTSKTQVSTQPVKERTSEFKMMDLAPTVHLPSCDTDIFYKLLENLSGD